MSDKELWNYIIFKKIAQTKPFDRLFLWIKKEDFLEIKKFFICEKNCLHKGKSYRSKNLFRHIHAIDQGEYFFIHKDTGNLARFLPLGLLHFFFDFLPYVFFCFFKRKPMNYFFNCPL